MYWDTVIGLEVHAQLACESKLFSQASSGFGAAANSSLAVLDLALPGTLPVLNEKALQLAIIFGLAIEAEILDRCYFERKNYFYPDLPKGYQISQYQRPIVSQGQLQLDEKTIWINRAHLEEDAGKLIHQGSETLIDLNRAGNPLLEIVTEPCMSSAAEALAYLRKLQQLLRFLGVSDANMQQGSFRCDVNISLREHGSSKLGTRVEIKNLNSFRFIEQAIHYEAARQMDCLEAGEVIVQETRLFDPDRKKTEPMRGKESDNDYRYFPDPDLLPITISEAYLASIREQMPETPQQIRLRLAAESPEDIEFLLSGPEVLSYFESSQPRAETRKLMLNWMRGTYLGLLNEAGLNFSNTPISPQQFAAWIDAQISGKLTAKSAKQALVTMLETQETLASILQRLAAEPKQDIEALQQLVFELIKNHPEQAQELRAGKMKILSFFMGQLMKATKGRFEAKLIEELIRKAL